MAEITQGYIHLLFEEDKFRVHPWVIFLPELYRDMPVIIFNVGML